MAIICKSCCDGFSPWLCEHYATFNFCTFIPFHSFHHIQKQEHGFQFVGFAKNTCSILGWNQIFQQIVRLLQAQYFKLLQGTGIALVYHDFIFQFHRPLQWNVVQQSCKMEAVRLGSILDCDCFCVLQNCMGPYMQFQFSRILTLGFRFAHFRSNEAEAHAARKGRYCAW